MRPERRQLLLLGVLACLLGVVAYLRWPAGGPAVSAPVRTRGGATNPQASVVAPEVHLAALDADHARPDESGRNLFTFKAKPAPPSRPVVQAPAPQPIVQSGPPPPPPLPPIPLKFIGVLQSANEARVAILSDGRGAPLYGKEGETVLGQYKILRIAAESIEMAYLDGRGRQTIRLSGS